MYPCHSVEVVVSVDVKHHAHSVEKTKMMPSTDSQPPPGSQARLVFNVGFVQHPPEVKRAWGKEAAESEWSRRLLRSCRLALTSAPLCVTPGHLQGKVCVGLHGSVFGPSPPSRLSAWLPVWCCSSVVGIVSLLFKHIEAATVAHSLYPDVTHEVMGWSVKNSYCLTSSLLAARL